MLHFWRHELWDSKQFPEAIDRTGLTAQAIDFRPPNRNGPWPRCPAATTPYYTLKTLRTLLTLLCLFSKCLPSERGTKPARPAMTIPHSQFHLKYLQKSIENDMHSNDTLPTSLVYPGSTSCLLPKNIVAERRVWPFGVEQPATSEASIVITIMFASRN